MKKLLYYLVLVLGWMFIYVVFDVFLFQVKTSGVLKYALIVFLCYLYESFLPKFYVGKDAKEEKKINEESSTKSE